MFRTRVLRVSRVPSTRPAQAADLSGVSLAKYVTKHKKVYNTEPPKRLQRPIVPKRYAERTSTYASDSKTRQYDRILMGIPSITKAITSGKFPTPIIHIEEKSSAINSLPTTVPKKTYGSAIELVRFVNSTFGLHEQLNSLVVAEFPSALQPYTSQIDFDAEEDNMKPRIFLIVDGCLTDQMMASVISVSLQYNVSRIIIDENSFHKFYLLAKYTHGGVLDIPITLVNNIWKWVSYNHKRQRVDFVGVKDTPAGSAEPAKFYRGPPSPSINRPWGIILAFTENKSNYNSTKTSQDLMPYCSSSMKLVPSNGGFYPYDVAAGLICASVRQAIDSIDFTQDSKHSSEEEALVDPFLSSASNDASEVYVKLRTTVRSGFSENGKRQNALDKELLANNSPENDDIPVTSIY